MPAVEVAFSVDVAAPEGHDVCLVGNTAVLGAWDPLKAVKLKQDYKSQERTIWMCTVPLPLNQKFHYRFFVCKQQVRTDGAKSVVILKWETNVVPRVFSTLKELTDETNVLELPMATFGSYDGFTNISKGWLTKESEIQVHLHPNAVSLNNDKQHHSSFYIRCIPLDLSDSAQPLDHPSEAPLLHSSSDVLVSTLTMDDPTSKPQLAGGAVYNSHSFMTFKTHVQCPSQIGLQIDIYSNATEVTKTLLGTAFILPRPELPSQLATTVPITGGNSALVGSLAVNLLTIKPLPSPNLSMETTYQSQWVWGGAQALDIGHRGMGSSYSKANPHQENTIASFNETFNQGGDFIELDVLVTKDNVPVVYHDFHVCVSYTSNQSSPAATNTNKVAVKDLTLDQLHTMKLKSDNGDDLDLNNDPSIDLRPFPTLVQVLERVHPNVGINIEIKFPQMDANDVMECTHYPDLNATMDCILLVVLQHARSRRIVFSCFEPDTCTMLQLKQNKFPVLLLHEGETNLYVRYKDYRASTFHRGISWAVSEQLMGLALMCEVFLKEPSVLKRLKENQLITFVWGNDNNSPHTIEALRELRVDGLIYDRMDLHKPENQGKRLIAAIQVSQASVSAQNSELTSKAGQLASHPSSPRARSPRSARSLVKVTSEVNVDNNIPMNKDLMPVAEH